MRMVKYPFSLLSAVFHSHARLTYKQVEWLNKDKQMPNTMFYGPPCSLFMRSILSY